MSNRTKDLEAMQARLDAATPASVLAELIPRCGELGRLQREVMKKLQQLPGDAADGMEFLGKTNHEWVSVLSVELSVLHTDLPRLLRYAEALEAMLLSHDGMGIESGWLDRLWDETAEGK